MLDTLQRSTEELRASERRNEAFLDAVPDVIFRVTRDGTITDARSPTKLPLMETSNDLVGRDAEQILALYSFLSPEHFTRSIAATEAALDTGVPQTLSSTSTWGSGRRYYQERFVASGKDEVIVLVREVTALKQVEEARRQGGAPQGDPPPGEKQPPGDLQPPRPAGARRRGRADPCPPHREP